jgi:hypothetical protein
MALPIRHRMAPALAPVLAGDFVRPVAEAPLDGVGAGTIGGQKQPLQAGMWLQPALDGGGLVDFTVGGCGLEPVKAPGRIGTR